jgi:hypothetical protein
MIKVVKAIRAEQLKEQLKKQSKSFSTFRLTKRYVNSLVKVPVFKNKIYTPVKHIEYKDSI